MKFYYLLVSWLFSLSASFQQIVISIIDASLNEIILKWNQMKIKITFVYLLHFVILSLNNLRYVKPRLPTPQMSSDNFLTLNTPSLQNSRIKRSRLQMLLLWIRWWSFSIWLPWIWGYYSCGRKDSMLLGPDNAAWPWSRMSVCVAPDMTAIPCCGR